MRFLNSDIDPWFVGRRLKGRKNLCRIIQIKKESFSRQGVSCFYRGASMILGMSTSTFTLLHVVISLIGIGSGLVVMYGLLTAKRLDRWTALFLVTTALTSISGFGFPFEHLSPGHKVGIISLVVLAIAIPARYVFHLTGAWRAIYVIGAAMALYFNVFVLIVQLFLKVGPLHALAPNGKEPPFLIAQIAVLAIFVVLTIAATKRFRVESRRTA
jgi:hypothetical protein